MSSKTHYSLWRRIMLSLFGDPGVPKEKWAELERKTDPKERANWYMDNVYDRRDIGWLRTQRPLRSPRMAAMLADPLVAPLVREALHRADREAVRDANADLRAAPQP